jgi:hypothetical protein
MEKRSSLLQKFLNYGRKKFNGRGPAENFENGTSLINKVFLKIRLYGQGPCYKTYHFHNLQTFVVS